MEREGPVAGEWTGPPSSPSVMDPRAETEPFIAIHRLLREHHVQVVMAGDTHYFEHYRETYQGESGPGVMHHFVNGGGGAYISIGTPLDWPHVPGATTLMLVGML